MNTAFINKLEELGYFKGLAQDRTLALKQEFEQQGWFAIFSDSHRLFMTDAEDLAEGGVGQFLQGISPFLSAQKITLPVIKDDVSEDGYVVRIGDAIHKIYDAAELERDSSGEEGGLTWGLSAVRSFRLVDELLATAGSEERAYALNGGNDLSVMFLTPKLQQFIMSHPGASRNDGPYVLKEEYPLFGQPDGQ